MALVCKAECANPVVLHLQKPDVTCVQVRGRQMKKIVMKNQGGDQVAQLRIGLK